MRENRSLEELENVVSKFKFEGAITEIVPYGDGHINQTYKVTSKNHTYILQRINHEVFANPEALMDNIQKVTSYLAERQKEMKIKDYQVLSIVLTQDEKAFCQIDEEYWRAYTFVQNSKGHTYTDSLKVLNEAGKAFGLFQKLLADFPAEVLYKTIPDFHNTPKRYENLMKAVEDGISKRVLETKEEIEFCRKYQEVGKKIVQALQDGSIPYRVTHNDTKINNVLMDKDTSKALCVIDLDTVMPGSSLFDFGDSIRSCGAAAAEDEVDLTKVKLDIKRFKAYTEGYMEELSDAMTGKEIELLPYAAIILTYECGMRFLTDYLEGDVYFRIHHEKHNLERAKNQLTLAKDMMDHVETMKEIVQACL